MRRLILLAALLMVGAGVFTRARRREIAQVSLERLTMRRERWLDRRVLCGGRVESFSDERGRYFALEQDGYRVALEGVPEERLAALEGRRASVLGTFGYREGLGNFIQAERLTPAALQ